MKPNSTRLTLACLAIAVLAVPAAFAQQQSSIPDQYQGVSHPPLDDEIVATPDTPAPAPVRATKPKPSPYVTVPPPPASPAPTPALAPSAAPSYSTSDNAPVVTASPAADTNRWNGTDYGIVAAPAPGSSAAPSTSNSAPAITTGPASDTRRWDNTDFGIVTVPVPPGEDDPQVPSDDTAVLRVRSSPSQYVASSGPRNELPAGTQIRIRIAEALSTDSTQVGAPFHGRVVVNVMQGGSVIIPAGSTLRGRVAQVSQGHHFGGAATLRLRPEIVVLPDGTAYHIYAQVEYSNADNTRIGSEGGIRPDSHATKNTVEYGAGVGSGAIIGAALGGPPGALAGTIIGAGLVTTHLLMQQPDAASVPAGSDITFGLTEPLYLIPTRN